MAKHKPANTPSSNGQEAAPAAEQVLTQNLPAPVCPYHQQPCQANRSEPFFTRYYCTVEACSYSQKVPRPRLPEAVRRSDEEEGFSAR